MICDVCGHANAERLTFCQECGRRLKSREARVVAPTPPRGLPKVVIAPSAGAPTPSPLEAAVAAAAGPPHSAHHAAPQHAAPQHAAPQHAAPQHAAPSAASAAAPAGPSRPGRSRPESVPPVPPPPPVPGVRAGGAPAASDPGAPVPASKTRDPADPVGAPQPRGSSPGPNVTCPTCGSTNPPMYRFCVTCGVTLPRDAAKAAAANAQAAPAQQAPAPAPAQPVPVPVPVQAAPVQPALVAAAPSPPAPVQAAPSVAAASAPAPGRLEERIIGSPVVEIAPGGGAPQKPIVCPRCQGQCIPAARFCQFCGAPLPGAAGAGGPVPAARPSEEARPAPAPAPAAAPARASATSRGRLVVIEADGSEGMSFPLADRPLDVGRLEGDILVKEDPYVSPRHARLVPDGNRWLVRDLASTNGVYLRLKKPYLLQDADLLLLGQEVLQFQLVSEPEKGLGHANQHGTLLFGSPITSRSARLCQRTVEGIVRDVYYLHRDETVIGRETGDIVFTADPFLSRRHAAIRRSLARKEGAGASRSRWDFTLTDLDSSNGTFVAIRNEVALLHGDFIRVGQHLFRVDFA